MASLSRRSIFLLAMLAIWVATVLALSASLVTAARQIEWFSPAIVAKGLLDRDLVDPPDDDAIRRAIVRAVTEAADDPHTIWIPPEQAAAFEKAVNASYAGIGAEIDTRDGWLLIVTPLEDSPAAAAGLAPGDLILSIDGVSTRNRLPAECAPLLLGEPGTPVTIVVRQADGVERTVEIIRQRIAASAIRGFERGLDGWRFAIDPERRLGYIRLSQFTERAADDLRAALASLRNELGGAEPEGVILDLRFNGGGSLGAAVDVADEFLASGRIVQVRPRHGEPHVADADGREGFTAPLLIMVNGGSASASEVVAGALQDHGRAVVLGTRTFGKGSVQEVRELPENFGLLKLTIARWETPSGRVIERLPDATTWGIDPDPGFHVAMRDSEYRALFSALRRWEVPAAGRTDEGDAAGGRDGDDASGSSLQSSQRTSERDAGVIHPASEHHETGRDTLEVTGSARAAWDDPEWLRSTLGDRQLAAALEALRQRLATGAWVAVGDIATDDSSRREELDRATETRAQLLERIGQLDELIERLDSGAAP